MRRGCKAKQGKASKQIFLRFFIEIKSRRRTVLQQVFICADIRTSPADQDASMYVCMYVCMYAGILVY